MDRESRNKAYDLGSVARKGDKCPYDRMDLHADEWAKGYDDANRRPEPVYMDYRERQRYLDFERKMLLWILFIGLSLVALIPISLALGIIK